MIDARNYLVAVLYREPLFERSIERPGPPYRWTFELEVTSRALAIEEARRRFEACRLESGRVGAGARGVRGGGGASPYEGRANDLA